MNNEEQDYKTDAQLLRIKAEEQLTVNKKKTGNAETEPDIKKLLHELQVHQIELEMQNEELHEANETTELALKRYTMLYDLAPMGYFTLDQNGTILELNFTGAEMLGDRRFSLVNSNFKLFVADEYKSTFNDFLNKVFSKIHKESCEVQLGYANKKLSYVHIEGVVIGEEHNCLLSLIDISSIRK